MGRAPCCSKVGLHRGPWTAREDSLLTKYIQVHGEGNWRSLPKKAGLLRCGKSCRLRWMNYLRPDIKRGNITPDEDDLIVKMHALLGNRWSLIAGRLPGRTDNEIKNYWNTHLSKRLRSQGTDPFTHKKLSDPTCRILQQPKKRRSSSNSNRSKKKINKSKSINAADDQTHREKMKAHNPKPIRISSLNSFSVSRNNSFDWTTATATTTPSGYSSSHEREGGLLLGTEVVDDDDVPWSNFKADVDYDRGNNDEVGFLIGIGGDYHQDNHDLINGSDFECQSHAPIPDNSLDKLYDEYLQLLKKTEDEQVQLDSFAESLFI